MGVNTASLPLGFIGLGDMGGPMAANIARGGFALTVHDQAGSAERAPAGAACVADGAAVAAAAEVIFVSVPDGAASLAVARAVAAAPRRRARALVNLSTVGVAATGPLLEALAGSGIVYIDAPVSGGRAGAVKGTVTLMWSGEQNLLDELRPVLDSFAGAVFFVGPRPGQGQALKLLNNYLSAVAMTATSEAVLFGLSQGLELKTLLEVVNVSTGVNSATRDKFPQQVLTERFDAGFRMALMEKDVALYLSEARAAGTPTRLGELVADVWRQGVEHYPDGDFTEVFKLIRGQG